MTDEEFDQLQQRLIADGEAIRRKREEGIRKAREEHQHDPEFMLRHERETRGMPPLSHVQELTPTAEEYYGGNAPAAKKYIVILDWNDSRPLPRSNEYGSDMRGSMKVFGSRDAARRAAWARYRSDDDWQAHLPH